jgi:hypothetical protein
MSRALGAQIPQLQVGLMHLITGIVPCSNHSLCWVTIDTVSFRLPTGSTLLNKLVLQSLLL